ncbi:MAG: mechanosensitive ion channel family protein [Acidiferrobacterales bacterium]
MRKKIILLLFVSLSIFPAVANISFAGGLQPLMTTDTKSPRNTLKSFLDSAREAYATGYAVRDSYFTSSRLYLSDSEKQKLDSALALVEHAKRTLNLSKVPEVIADKVAMDSVLELIEVLGRIDLPEISSVPDLKAMEAAKFKRWNIPGTDIIIVRVEKGSRAGEYLFSPETIDQLPDFYQRTKHLPYKPGAAKNAYNNFRYGGAGLRGVIPLKWMEALPSGLKIIVLDQPVWRWIGIVALLLLAMTIMKLVQKLTSYWSEKGSDTSLRKPWAKLARLVTLLLLILVVIDILAENLRVGEEVFTALSLTLWVSFTIIFAWVVWLGGNVVAETIVRSQNLLAGSIDSQLVRLGLRLVSSILAVTVLVVGAQNLGIPAYSIITGLGIGGIAVALAAKDSLANLLGSLLIMFEKPFRVGHWIRVGDSEGRVESVGFRSTRIRTVQNSLLSIPSDKLVNSVVDNMGLRERRRVHTTLHLNYNTDAQKVEDFVAGINNILESSDSVDKENIQVGFSDFGNYGLGIELRFFLKVPDSTSEQTERQIIMMAILKLANNAGIEFALPANRSGNVT